MGEGSLTVSKMFATFVSQAMEAACGCRCISTLRILSFPALAKYFSLRLSPHPQRAACQTPGGVGLSVTSVPPMFAFGLEGIVTVLLGSGQKHSLSLQRDRSESDRRRGRGSRQGFGVVEEVAGADGKGEVDCAVCGRGDVLDEGVRTGNRGAAR